MNKVMRLFCVVILCVWSTVNADGLSDMQKGIDAQNRGDIDSAIPLYTRAITGGDLGTDNLSIAFNSRGNAWSDKGDYDRAISDYNQAISLNPQYAEAYNNRGVAWRDKGDYDRAISDYNQTISLNPQYAEAYYNRGVRWGYKGEYDLAISDYNQTISLNPQHASAHNNLSWLYATSKNGKYRDGYLAVKYGEKALALEPEAFDIFDTLAAAYARAGDFQKAINLQEKAIRLGNQNGEDITGFKDHLMLYQAGRTYVDD